MFPQVKQLRQADGGGAEREGWEEGKVKCLRTCGKKWDKEGGERGKRKREAAERNVTVTRKSFAAAVQFARGS